MIATGKYAVYRLSDGRVRMIVSGSPDAALLQARPDEGVIQVDGGSPATIDVDVQASPHAVIQRAERRSGASATISSRELKRLRARLEDRPVALDGVLWDCDERSLHRLEALGAVASKMRRRVTLRLADNKGIDLDHIAASELPGRIRVVLGDRFERLNAEYNAIKAEINGGATVTYEQARARMEAQL